MNNTFLIVAGEASGDRHAAELIREMKKITPGISFWGIGGDEMKKLGVHLFYHIHQMAFLGFAEVIRHLPFIQKVFRTLRDWVDRNRPAAVIVIDYPGFNLRLAKQMSRLGIPVIYYITPQLWAWHEKRVEKIRKYISLPLVIFKFEEEFYKKHGVHAKFVGHPLVDEITISLSDSEFRKKYGLSESKKIVALLPGSRKNEVKELLPVMAESTILFEHESDIEWVVGKSPAVDRSVFDTVLKKFPAVHVIENDSHHIMKYAYVALVASGTATLELGFLGTPMVVLYKVAPLTYSIGKRLIKIPYIALANIVCGKKVVPELIQQDLTKKNIQSELRSFFNDSDYYKNVCNELNNIPRALGKPGGAERAASEIMKFLDMHKST